MAVNWKKIRKVVLIVLGVVVLAIASFLGYGYYQIVGKYDVNEEKYANYIGFLSDTNENSNFKKCNQDKLVGWFSSAADAAPIFKGSKSNFKKQIQENFVQVNSADNGFLNLRFIINCKGEIGNLEVTEFDSDYQLTEFSPKLVEQLITLSSKKENWVVPVFDEEPTDSYM